MGFSTDGQLCYGYQFEEGYEFPWGIGSVEDWWREINGYVPPFQLYADKGDDSRVYHPSIELFPPKNRWEHESPKREVLDVYYNAMQAWDKANPLPVEDVNYCSVEYPMCILAVPSSVRTASRGYPQKIIPNGLRVTQEEAAALAAFIERHGLKPEAGPCWWLCSYWG